MNHRTAKAFTLVELMVVVAIVALLVSLLMPSLKKARSQTMIVVCSTNLRSMNMSTLTYSSDHFGWGPPHSYNASPNAAPYIPNFRVGSNGHEVQASPGGIYAGINPYLTDPNLRCPTNAVQNYCAANEHILGLFKTHSFDKWHTLFSVKKADRVVLIAEGYFGMLNGARAGVGPTPQHNADNAAYDYLGTDPNAPYSIGNIAHALRHDLPGGARHDARGLTFGFVDGHVAFYRHVVPQLNGVPITASDRFRILTRPYPIWSPPS